MYVCISRCSYYFLLETTAPVSQTTGFSPIRPFSSLMAVTFMRTYYARGGRVLWPLKLNSNCIVCTHKHHCHQTSPAYYPTFLSLHLHHSSFCNPSVALPMAQLILQPFYCFTYITAHSPNLLSLLLHHRLFTYVTWRASHGQQCSFSGIKCIRCSFTS